MENMSVKGMRCPQCGYMVARPREWYAMVETKELEDVECPQCGHQKDMNIYDEWV